MSERKLTPLTSYEQVPKGMTEEEAHEFWSTHSITDEYLASAPPISEDDIAPADAPSEWVALHVKREAYQRARKLARRRGNTVAELFDALVTQAMAAEAEGIRAVSS